MPKCQICGQDYKKITASHLQKHDISYDDYLKKFNKEQYYYRRSAKILFDLYVYTRKKWLNQISKGNRKGQYVTIQHLEYCEKEFVDKNDKGKYRKWPLNETDIKKHTEGMYTYGVYFNPYRSKIIALDIDIKNSYEALEALERVCEALYVFGIPREAILASLSGNKGYHVDVFLSDMLEAEKIKKFYNLILQETEYKKNQIELRGVGSQGYKLPLGIHRKTDNFCYLCDEHGRKLEENEKILEKLESVERVSSKVIVDAIEMNDILYFTQKEEKEIAEIINDYEGLEIYKNPLESLIKSYWEKGITRKSTRHSRAFVLGIAYRDKGMCQKEIEKNLLEWHKTLDKKFYKSSWEEIEKDCEKISKSVFNKKYQIPAYNVEQEAIITKKEMGIVLSVKDNAGRKLIFALINHAKMYAAQRGIFYMTYDQINEAMGTRHRISYLKSKIDKLEEEGFIEIIARNQTQKGTFRKKPNRYKVIGLDLSLRKSIKSKKRILKMCKEKKCKDCMERVICAFLSRKEIKEKMNYRQARKLKRTVPCSNIV